MADLTQRVRMPYDGVRMEDAEGNPRVLAAGSYLVVEPTTDPNRMRILRIGQTRVGIPLYIHPSFLEEDI